MTIEEELAYQKSSMIIFELLKLRAIHSYDDILDEIWKLQAFEESCKDNHQEMVNSAFAQPTAH